MKMKAGGNNTAGENAVPWPADGHGVEIGWDERDVRTSRGGPTNSC